MSLCSDFDGDDPIVFTPYKQPNTLTVEVAIKNNRLALDLFVNGGKAIFAVAFECLPFRKVRMSTTVASMENGVIRFLSSDTTGFTIKREMAYEPNMFLAMFSLFLDGKMELASFIRHCSVGFFVESQLLKVLQEIKCSPEALLWIANKGR